MANVVATGRRPLHKFDEIQIHVELLFAFKQMILDCTSCVMFNRAHANNCYYELFLLSVADLRQKVPASIIKGNFNLLKCIH